MNVNEVIRMGDSFDIVIPLSSAVHWPRDTPYIEMLIGDGAVPTSLSTAEVADLANIDPMCRSGSTGAPLVYHTGVGWWPLIGETTVRFVYIVDHARMA